MGRAGITLSSSTACSTQKGMVGIAGPSSADIQQRMRAAMMIAEPNLRAFDMGPTKWWDYAARHGMLQKRWAGKVMRGEATCRQLERAVGAPWGAAGEVALLPGSPERQKGGKSKQLQRRMVSCV